MADNAADACPICLDLVIEDALHLECGHLIHGACATQMRRHGVTEGCPLCREPVAQLRGVERLVDEACALADQADLVGQAHVSSCRADIDIPDVHAEMLSLAREAYSLDEKHPDVHFILGEALARCQCYSEAVQHFQAMLSRDCRNPQIAHFMLGMSLLNMGHMTQAVSELQQAMNIAPKWWKPPFHLSTISLQMAQAKKQSGGDPLPDLAEAERLAQIAVGLHASEAHIHVMLASICIMRGSRQEAQAHAERAFEVNSAFEPAKRFLALLAGEMTSDMVVMRRSVPHWEPAYSPMVCHLPADTGSTQDKLSMVLAVLPSKMWGATESK
mmetsp:Transcript_78551/g.168315  ORF Transcript_78551/g.168315 Transcript_78551/m.168315 type:complete len:329 (-) Transcript_78551:60-1046(-)